MMYQKKIPIFCVLLFLLLAPIYAKVPVQDLYLESDGNGLVIQSVPAEAEVYIDGIRRGRTPLILATLVPGTYQLVLVKEGYETRSVLITLTSGKRLDLTLVLARATGLLSIEIERRPGSPGPERLPLEPQLFVDDLAVSSPYLKLPVGFHRVRVEAFGWESVERTVMVFQDFPQILTVRLEPASFRISDFYSERRRLNPYNSGMLGATDIRFSVSAAGTGTLTIVDSNNSPVYEYRFSPFSEKNQQHTWKGTDASGSILRDGSYTLILTANSIPYDDSEPVLVTKQIPIVIDSSLVIRPWSIASGASGLLYMPLPETLGSGSFQMDSRLVFGLPFGAASPFNSVPFSFGLRFSPANSWEVGVSGEFDAAQDPLANQLSLALRRAFLKSAPDFPMNLALDFSWTAAELSPLSDPTAISWSGSMGGFRMGLPIFIPLWKWAGFGISPALLWPMDLNSSGYTAFPGLELGAGFAGMGATITGGTSAKMIWLGQNEAGLGWTSGPIFAAAELHWFPKPSVFVFHLYGGLWYYREQFGAFSSIGLGFIH
ncbi:MAG: PEGA domain-containing protein [Treponema sp.]|nr:PEGA domain-containing protein [Treponema sp.]